MASYTSNLNLKKPAGTEDINVADINGNMDLIDAKFGSFTGTVKENFDSTTNRIGVLLCTDGTQVAFDASTMAKIGEWIKTKLIQNRWVAVRCTNTGTSNPVIGVSEFGLIFCLSSVNYGWGILMTDNSGLVGGTLFGQLSSGTWKWYKPTVTQV